MKAMKSPRKRVWRIVAVFNGNVNNPKTSIVQLKSCKREPPSPNILLQRYTC